MRHKAACDTIQSCLSTCVSWGSIMQHHQVLHFLHVHHKTAACGTIKSCPFSMCVMRQQHASTSNHALPTCVSWGSSMRHHQIMLYLHVCHEAAACGTIMWNAIDSVRMLLRRNYQICWIRYLFLKIVIYLSSVQSAIYFCCCCKHIQWYNSNTWYTQIHLSILSKYFLWDYVLDEWK